MKISRRHLLLSAAVPLLAQKRDDATHPNVLLVVASDVASWMVGCYGNKEIQTPEIDLLAKMGTRFLNSCVYTPASSPSRATLFTGRLPSQHGIVDFLTDNPIADPPQGQKEPPASFRNEIMLSDLLSGAGYQCGYVGEWDMGNDAQPGHGFSYALTLAGKPSYTDPEFFNNGQRMKHQGYQADIITSRCVEFIGRQSAAKPFFLTAAYLNARPPYDGQPQKYYDLYAKSDFHSFSSFPTAKNALRNRAMMDDTVGSWRKCAAAVTALDEQLGVLIKQLQAKKLWENTLIIFTSDCGNLGGNHGLWGGGYASNPINLYEQAIQVPMIWSWPGRVPVGGFRPELVSFYDFLPSVCAAIDVPAPTTGNLHGMSYAELAFGKGGDPNHPWRGQMFAEYRNTAMARDFRYKMIVRDGGKGPGELYDLRADRAENENQYDNDEYVEVRRRLSKDLDEWHGLPK
jgi:arylsulfatase A-like enzyme